MSKELEKLRNEINEVLCIDIKNWSKQYDLIKKDLDVLEQALQELKELRGKVKRYFELQRDFPIFTREEYGEHNQLCRELSKVGKKDE